MWTPVTYNPGRIIAGGTVSGISYIIMRYMGIASIILPGTIKRTGGSVVAHLVLAILGTILEHWIFFRVLSLLPRRDILRKVCTALGFLVSAGLTYIIFTGIALDYDGNKDTQNHAEAHVASTHLLPGVFVTTVFLSFLAIFYVIWDLRSWVTKTATQLRMADRAILALLHRPPAERIVITPLGTVQSSVVQRHTQAPPEVVSYTRQYLRHTDDNDRAGPHSSVFTYQHKLYHDIDFEFPVSNICRENSPGISHQGSMIELSDGLAQTVIHGAYAPNNVTTSARDSNCPPKVDKPSLSGTEDRCSTSSRAEGNSSRVVDSDAAERNCRKNNNDMPADMVQIERLKPSAPAYLEPIDRESMSPQTQQQQQQAAEEGRIIHSDN